MMKKINLIFSVILFVWVSSLNAQYVSGMYNSGAGAAGNSQEMLEKIQTVFIEDVFTKPLMESQDIFKDDDDHDYITGKAQKDLMRDLFAQVMAKELARQDILGLKKMYDYHSQTEGVDTSIKEFPLNDYLPSSF